MTDEHHQHTDRRADAEKPTPWRPRFTEAEREAFRRIIQARYASARRKI